MKRFFALFSTLLVFSLVISVAHAQDTAVSMPDTNLKSAVRKALNLANNAPITETNIIGLTMLHAPKKRIANLTGLEHATELKKLIVWQNRIVDLTPISNLTKLTELRIGANKITDVTPISNLTNLTRLAMQRNKITDVSALSGLVKLQWLRLVGNNIADTSVLHGPDARSADRC